MVPCVLMPRLPAAKRAAGYHPSTTGRPDAQAPPATPPTLRYGGSIPEPATPRPAAPVRSRKRAAASRRPGQGRRVCAGAPPAIRTRAPTLRKNPRANPDSPPHPDESAVRRRTPPAEFSGHSSSWSPQSTSLMTNASVARAGWDSRNRRKASASSSLKFEAHPSSTNESPVPSVPAATRPGW